MILSRLGEEIGAQVLPSLFSPDLSWVLGSFERFGSGAVFGGGVPRSVLSTRTCTWSMGKNLMRSQSLCLKPLMAMAGTLPDFASRHSAFFLPLRCTSTLTAFRGIDLPGS